MIGADTARGKSSMVLSLNAYHSYSRKAISPMVSGPSEGGLHVLTASFGYRDGEPRFSWMASNGLMCLSSLKFW